MTADYVIVGAGSAGCVLAARLSEDPATQVVLLEAGPPDDCDEIRVPAAFYRLFLTRWDWCYRTEPDKGVAGRSLYWPRGRTVGGSSSINAMIYIRGNRLDYDAWRDEYGCAGWGFDDLLPYFRRAEDNAFGRSEYHGTGGPLRVENSRHLHTLSRAFLAAAVEAGLPANPDFNGAGQDGVGRYQVTQRSGRRWSAADAYLRPALRRPNLRLVTDALVTGIDLEDGRAVGVTYRHRGAEVTVRAKREVILSGGAINSPHLLALSGVGPAADLRAAGIDVVLDAPNVGANLADHPASPLLRYTRDTDDLYAAETPAGTARWALTRRGKLTSNVAEVGGFVRSTPDRPAPDIQFHVVPGMVVEHGTVDPPGRGFTVLVTLVAPVSRGRIVPRDADPAHPPLIEPGYFRDPVDLDALVAGVRVATRIAGRRPLARYLRAPYPPGAPADDDELAEAIRSTAQTLYHPVGTCAMGAEPDSVVDTELRVRGVDGLRVVDASVLPTVPRGNTNAPVIAVAERASDLIRGREPRSA